MAALQLSLYVLVGLSAHAMAQVTPVNAQVTTPVFAMSGERIFDGVQDKCVDSAKGWSSDLPMGGSAYTIEAWVKPNEVMPDESFGIVGWGIPGHSQLNGLIFYRGSHSLRNIWWQNDLQAYLDEPLADGSYHHVAATWDGNMHRMFVDFVEVASRTASGYSVTQKDNFCVGRAWHHDGSPANFRGSIKDLKIWKVARTAPQMRSRAEQKVEVQASLASLNKELDVLPMYQVHTQHGFLNIHSEPGNPFRIDNVVGRWLEGDIVKVVGEPLQTEYGAWLQTAEGWSIQIYGGFHWLRVLAAEDEATQRTNGVQTVVAQPTVTPSQGDSDMDEKFEYEGILSLHLSASESGVHLQTELSTRKNAVLVGLKSYFSFASVWLQSTFEVAVPSGRKLRSNSGLTTVRFRARGGGGALGDDTGLKAEMQAAFQAEGARLTVDAASVEWFSAALPHEEEKPFYVHTWAVILISSFASLGLIVVCCGSIGMYHSGRKRQATNQKETVSSEAVNPVKATKDNDVASESTGDGDGSVEDIASSCASASEEASVEEQGAELY